MSIRSRIGSQTEGASFVFFVKINLEKAVWAERSKGEEDTPHAILCSAWLIVCPHVSFTSQPTPLVDRNMNGCGVEKGYRITDQGILCKLYGSMNRPSLLWLIETP